MASTRNSEKLNPKTTASAISIIFFTWMTGLLYKGWRRTLTEDDIYPLLHGDHSSILGHRLYRNWEKHLEDCAKKQKRPHFRYAVFITFYKPFLFYGIFSMVEECVIRLIQVISLGALIDYFNADLAKLNSYLVAQTAVAGIVISSVFFMLSFHWSIYGCHHTCTQMRIAVSSVIFQKTLKLSQSSLKSFSIGQLITLLSSDVHRFDQQDLHLNYIWIAPLQLLIVMYLLYFYYEFGLASIAGLGLLLVFVFAQYFIARYIAKVRLKKIVASNSRMKVIIEIMQAFHSIKMYALESNFYKFARESRLKELGFLRKAMIVRMLNTSISLILTKLTIFVTLLCYVNDDKPINSSRVFITILMYEHVRINFAYLFVQGWTDLAEITVTFKRLTNFLLLEEPCACDNYQLLPAIKEDKKNRKASCGFNIQSLYCKWNQKQEKFGLKSINLAVKSKDFVAIVGSQGSGKSLLISAILGEIQISEGSIVVQGRIAYVPQTPWLFYGTIRDNILFGMEYEEAWYQEVLEICTISIDIERMVDGDSTQVFFAGLSTGQKARIGFARAVYSKADIFLMDDPFNSIDLRLSRLILENCIKGILKEKAVLLITHQVHFLEEASRVVIMADGEFTAEGPYKELLQKGVEFADEVEADLDIIVDDDEDAFRRHSFMTAEEGEDQLLIKEASGLVVFSGSVKSIASITAKEVEAEVTGAGGKRSRESRHSHTTPIPYPVARGIRLYWLYLKSSASKIFLFFLLFLSFILQILYSGSDFWLELWINFEEQRQHFPTSPAETNKLEFHKTRGFHIIVYFSLIPALVVVTIARSLVMFKICINASLSLYCQLTDSLLRASTSFIDTNGIGHGINKFSKDILVIDELLPATLYDITEVAFEVLGAIAILGYCEPWFLIPSFIFLFLCIVVYRIYHTSAAALKRIESNARSPVYGHVANTLEGVMTIRAYNREDLFMDIFDEHLNNHTSSWTLYIASSAWLAVIIDWLSIFLVSVMTLGFIYQDKSTSAFVGLAIAKAVELSILAQIAVVETGDMETEMISVERILEYIETPPEGEWEKPERMPQPPWPDRGRIEFINITQRGYTGREILRNVSFSIDAGQKVGIVGRSGSGKSTLFNLLFRILDPKAGKICIDGTDIHDIGFHDLRKNLSILPQVSHLFTGTLRSNIDPFEEFEDREIWHCLGEVGLFDVVKNMDKGLYSYMCPESGWSLTDAQTQLLSLARVLIRKCKILCCDEGTSFLDPETQSFVTKKLREHFTDCTVLTIAHRVHTVIDYDIIMVLEAGQVVDFGEPYTLIKQQGAFFQLINNFGKTTQDEIIKLAKDAYDKRRTGKERTSSIKHKEKYICLPY